MAGKRTDYLLFCDQCGMPQLIPIFIMHTYIARGVGRVYCKNCEKRIEVPDYLRKIAEEL